VERLALAGDSEKVETQGDPWSSSVSFVPPSHVPWTKCWADVHEAPLPNGTVPTHECPEHSKTALGLCPSCALALLP
jgi:hypothetical protein